MHHRTYRWKIERLCGGTVRSVRHAAPHVCNYSMHHFSPIPRRKWRLEIIYFLCSTLRLEGHHPLSNHLLSKFHARLLSYLKIRLAGRWNGKRYLLDCKSSKKSCNEVMLYRSGKLWLIWPFPYDWDWHCRLSLTGSCLKSTLAGNSHKAHFQKLLFLMQLI